VAHENGVDRLQVILGGKVHHGQIFVLELPVLLCRVAVAAHEMLE